MKKKHIWYVFEVGLLTLVGTGTNKEKARRNVEANLPINFFKKYPYLRLKCLGRVEEELKKL